MEELKHHFYSKDFGVLIGEMRKLVRKYKGEALKRELKYLIGEGEDEILREWRERKQANEHTHDDLLNILGSIVSSIIYGDAPIQRAYLVQTKCPKCPPERAYQKQIIPVKNYISERDFDPFDPSEDLRPADGEGFTLECVHGCGVMTDVTSSSNLLVARKEPILYTNDLHYLRLGAEEYHRRFLSDHPLVTRLSTREKSAQGEIEKLTKLIVYDESNPQHKKRSLADRFALQIGLDYHSPNGRLRSKDLSSDRLAKRIGGMFKKLFGMTLEAAARPAISYAGRLEGKNPNTSERAVTEETFATLDGLLKLHYAMQGLIMKRGSQAGMEFYDPLDDKLLNPRANGFKSLQSHILYGGKLFEMQIKPEQVIQGESTYGSRLFHPSYHEVELDIWKTTMDPEVEPIIVEVLWELWGNKKKFSDRIQSLIGGKKWKKKG